MLESNALWGTACLNVLAIVATPIIALWVQRKGDDHRALKRRCEEIFRQLWINRARPLYIARVDALNMIDVEFHGEQKVLDAWEDLFSHYNTDYIGQGTPLAESERFHREKYSTLLFEISQTLGYRYGKAHIRDHVYRPGTHNTIDEAEFDTRFAMRDILKALSQLDALPVRIKPGAVDGSGGTDISKRES